MTFFNSLYITSVLQALNNYVTFSLFYIKVKNPSYNLIKFKFNKYYIFTFSNFKKNFIKTIVQHHLLT